MLFDLTPKGFVVHHEDLGLRPQDSFLTKSNHGAYNRVVVIESRDAVDAVVLSCVAQQL